MNYTPLDFNKMGYEYSDNRKGKAAGLLALLFVPVIALGVYFADSTLTAKDPTSYNSVISPLSLPLVTPTPAGIQVGIGGGGTRVD
ncbi:MAG: hypothetical protein ABIO02_04590 [Patescibacteria group bacterium]